MSITIQMPQSVELQPRIRRHNGVGGAWPGTPSTLMIDAGPGWCRIHPSPIRTLKRSRISNADSPGVQMEDGGITQRPRTACMRPEVGEQSARRRASNEI